MVSDAIYIYEVSQALSYMNPVMLDQPWRKHLPGLEDDYLQCIANAEINKSKILDIVYATRNSESVTKIMLKNGYKVVHVN
jgi:hypothetical protein